MPSALTQSELFALLAAGHTVVVPHPYAAKVLRSRLQQHRALDQANTDSGSIHAWQEWTSSLWFTLLLEGVEERVLLNRLQEERLWSVIMTPRSAGNATPPAALESRVELARSGLRLAATYNAVDRLRPAADSANARTFASWVDAFRDVCNRQNLLAPAFLDHFLARHLRAKNLNPPPSLYLVGFERLTPAQNDLVDALQLAGCDVQHHHLRHERTGSAESLAISADNAREQLRFAVRWIADQAVHGPATFALISPRIEDHRPELERLLREMLAPELEPVTADLSSTPWQFAAAPKLSSAALTTDALQLLRWLLGPLSLDRIAQLLLSPYFGFSDPLEQRARFAHRLRGNLRLLRPELDLTQFQQLAATGSAARLPEIQALVRLLGKPYALNGSRLHAEWADQIRAILSSIGWPGSRSLAPAEFVAVEAWEGVLDQLSTLDLNGRRVPFDIFLSQLEQEVARTALTVSAPAAPVQIATLADAEGLIFDHVLLLDATDALLPAPEPMHPLLSRRMQQALHMPGSDAGRTYAQTRSRVQALQERSGALHFVIPVTDSSGALRPTRLAADLQFRRADATDLLKPVPTLPPVDLTDVEETSPLPPLPSPVVQGGARVLELQSACGFRAFADLRLRASEPSALALGLDAREAGSRLHEALHLLWQELKDQATLRSMSTPDRRKAVEIAVRQALEPLARAPGSERAWPQAFLDVLQQRFSNLLFRWLDLELGRAPFTTVSQEQGREITVGPLQLSIRPDRVDRVQDGLVFIDYKTKYALSTDDWRGERPEAPQIPLYTLLAEPGEVRGLAFGQLRPGDGMAWHSLYETPNLFPKAKDNLQCELAEEVERWREELTRLAQAFADGDASVDPKSYPATCKFCAHQLLCRLDPTELLAQGAEDDEEVEEEVDA